MARQGPSAIVLDLVAVHESEGIEVFSPFVAIEHLSNGYKHQLASCQPCQVIYPYLQFVDWVL